MDFDMSLDQIAAGTYKQCYSVSNTNTFWKDSTPIPNHSKPMNFATSPSQIAAGTYLQDSTPNPNHRAPMNFAASRSQITAGTYLNATAFLLLIFFWKDSTPAPNHISPMNFATSRSQIAAGTYLQCFSVSITNSFGKILRLPLIIYHA